MLSIFICEDEDKQREKVETCIKNYILMEDLDMEVVLSTANPTEVLDYVESHDHTVGLYFLDIDLQHPMNGLTLAAEIRKIDDLGKIVFVTTHGEMSYLTFTYKIEAMDYIIKDYPEEIQQKIQACLRVAYERYRNDRIGKKQLFQVKLGDNVRSIHIDDIIFFEASPAAHRVILHLENSELEFYGSIKSLESISTDFYRCHKSYLINKNHIMEINKNERLVIMSNEQACLVSVRALSGLVKIHKR
ncbi:Accessory gene regulator protein A [Listeria grayi]|uniref:Accessory gene regulator A n=1 Tax=Listeria grayi FSL F6-1183 TaxID=1265827 RepID=A0A829RA97_LISGR|nr:LytTR family DNA-binding domain-containing protein [Listeria grayi]EUJ30435.1 accessory gene regulator A [Listeria grayi FSL F6-1183]VEI31268.1 Accessory gene regulator protein A [Listeria grayi]